MNINIYKVTFLLYQVLIFLNRFVIYLFRQKRSEQKKVSTCGQIVIIFYFTWPVDRTTFKVGLKRTCPCTILPPLFKIFQIPPSGEGNQNLLPSPLKRGRGLNYGPTLANVFFVILKIFWKQMLENCPSHFKQIVYRQFVDDTFLLI